jgi:ADP-ribose pyrophosphatase YjhB (NUDIX family)
MISFEVRLIIEDGDKGLFLLQTKKNGGKYSHIGGTVEQHEFAREALSRETREEAALIVEPAHLQMVHVLHRHRLKTDETSLVLYFKATRFSGEPVSLEPKKFSNVAWLPLHNLPENISKTTRHVLQAIERGEIYSEFPSRTKSMAFWEQFRGIIE